MTEIAKTERNKQKKEKVEIEKFQN